MLDLEITPVIKDTIALCVAKLSVDNHAKAEEACNRMPRSFHKLYKNLSVLANCTNNSIHVYTKLFLSLMEHSIGWLGQSCSLSSNLL